MTDPEYEIARLPNGDPITDQWGRTVLRSGDGVHRVSVQCPHPNLIVRLERGVVSTTCKDCGYLTWRASDDRASADR